MIFGTSAAVNHESTVAPMPEHTPPPTTIAITTAPAAYDYGYVIDRGVVTIHPTEYRVVEIPNDSVQYQCDRYASGMYVAAQVRSAQ